MSERIRVVVVDDHPLFREGVAHTLRGANFLELVGEGSTADDAVRIAKAELPNIVLIDVSMPGGGIEAARAIAHACPVVKTMMLTVSESEEHVAQALDAGAQGYLLKGTSGLELIAAMRSVARGGAKPTELADLTKREEQILDHVAQGRTNKEIAIQLKIGEKTVKHYMTNIMQKLQVRNRVEAVLALQKARMTGRN